MLQWLKIKYIEKSMVIREATSVKSSVPNGEFAWTAADFSRVQALIYQRAGISLNDGKHAMVYSRLSRRLRETGHQSFQGYLSWLESNDGPEWQEFINALTTNLTSFFREQHHFEIFASLLKSRSTGTAWKVWCSAASTGEEPYSIVMTAAESLGSLSNFKLTASDIDSKVLATASQGVYCMESLKGLSRDRLSRFFCAARVGMRGWLERSLSCARRLILSMLI